MNLIDWKELSGCDGIGGGGGASWNICRGCRRSQKGLNICEKGKLK